MPVNQAHYRSNGCAVCTLTTSLGEEEHGRTPVRPLGKRKLQVASHWPLSMPMRRQRPHCVLQPSRMRGRPSDWQAVSLACDQTFACAYSDTLGPRTAPSAGVWWVATIRQTFCRLVSGSLVPRYRRRTYRYDSSCACLQSRCRYGPREDQRSREHMAGANPLYKNKIWNQIDRALYERLRRSARVSDIHVCICDTRSDWVPN